MEQNEGQEPEQDLRMEYKRLFTRHRIDFAKLYFGKDGGYTLREFKKWYKLEMEENPERYTLNYPADQTGKAGSKDLEKLRKSVEKEGPIFPEVDQDRLQ